MADIGAGVWAVAGALLLLLLLAVLVGPRVGRTLSRGRRQAERLHATIAAGEERPDVLLDGRAGVRRCFVVTVVNDGDRAVHHVVVDCRLGEAAATSVAFGNQLSFHVWRTVAPRGEPLIWRPEFTLPADDARLLSGRRPPGSHVGVHRRTGLRVAT